MPKLQITYNATKAKSQALLSTLKGILFGQMCIDL